MQSELLASFELFLDYKIFFDNQYRLLCILLGAKHRVDPAHMPYQSLFTRLPPKVFKLAKAHL